MARILLVDDEPYVREAIEGLLTDYGHAVSVAEDGDAALEALKKRIEPCDLIISDYTMPHKNGLELLEQVRADYRFGNIPFILLSGNPSLQSRLQTMCGKAGVTFSLKPAFNLIELVDKALGPP
jgi:CheY-like chemotaxis protein